MSVQSSDDVTLLGVIIDKSLTFKKHIDNLVRKTQYKLHALRRIRKFLAVEKVKILGSTFIDSQFNYAPLNGYSVGEHFTLKLKKFTIRLEKMICDIRWLRILTTIFYYAATISQFIKGNFDF